MAEIGDAFPRRDLGGSAENWGRHLEQRIVKLESLFGQLDSMQGNLNTQSTGGCLQHLFPNRFPRAIAGKPDGHYQRDTYARRTGEQPIGIHHP